MTKHLALGAIAALICSVSVHADLQEPPEQLIDIGTFMNLGGGSIGYVGDYAEFISSSVAPGPSQPTVIDVDLFGLLSSVDVHAFSGVRITDTGQNQYGALSPGADVDYFVLQGLDPDVEVTYVYDGPNPVHQNESAEVLATRVSELDSVSGSQDAWNLTHVSLGDSGGVEA